MLYAKMGNNQEEDPELDKETKLKRLYKYGGEMGKNKSNWEFGE